MKINSNLTKAAGLFGFVALTSSLAFGLPWDIDMADAQTVKAYEWEMGVVPQGTVPQENPLSTVRYADNHKLGDDDLASVANPLSASPTVLATGGRMYDVYCSACHGDGKELGKVAENYPGVAVLKGSAGRLHKIQDGRLYATIRNGYGLMPAYGWAMSEDEIWSLIHHLRTMDNGKYVAPPPPTDEEAPQ